MDTRSSTNRYPRVTADEIGWLTEAQMIEVDRVMIEDLRIELIQMIENAGRNLAELVIELYAPQSVAVLAGSGGNGAGGLVAARHLSNRGVDVHVTLTHPRTDLSSIPTHQLDILERMGVPTSDTGQPSNDPDIVVDAMIGYSLRGAPRGRVAELIEWSVADGPPVLSLDTPSGLNVTDGSVPGVAVSADATLTLALPKVGLRESRLVGELFVADISVPSNVYADLGVAPAPPFGGSSIVRIVPG